jgi:Beta-lactamase class C and other penicillin binding proteins
MTLTMPQGLADNPNATTPSGILLSALEQHIDRLMAEYVERDVPGISVAVVKDGKIIFAKGYGYADLELKKPIDAEHTFLEPGSVSKLFTWTAVMQLVEQGKLDLHSDIRRYLPDDYLKLRYDEPVTMLHLMTHTAGFEERLEGLMVTDPNQLLALEEYLGPKHQPKQIYRPGTTIAYSNFSTSLAGLIVQRVSGQPFEEYIKQHIFEPLGMQRSYFSPRYDQIEGVLEQRARGYAKAGKRWKALPNFYINDMPAGSMTSTASDLARFLIAHLDRDGSSGLRLFNKPETLEQMHKVAFTHDPLLPGNAHGFWERFAGPHCVLEHGGNTNGFSALVSMVPEQNFGVCMLTNVAGETGGARLALIKLLIGGTFTDPVANPSLQHSREVAGSYRMARLVDSNFARMLYNTVQSDAHVSANPDGSIRVRMPNMGLDSDYVETAPYFYERCSPKDSMADKAGWDSCRIRFITDGDGKVVAMSQGVISDLVRVAPSDSNLINRGMLGFGALSLLAGFIVSVVGLWRDWRRVLSLWRNDADKLALLGGASLINLAVLLARGLSDPCIPLAKLAPQRRFFWLNLLASLYLGYRLVRDWRDQPLLKRVFVAVLLSGQAVFNAYLAKQKFLRLP